MRRGDGRPSGLRSPPVEDHGARLLPSPTVVRRRRPSLLDEHPHRQPRHLQDDLCHLAPGLRKHHVGRTGGAVAAATISLEEQGLTGQTPLAHASFGTIRALALLAVLHDPAPPKLTCVEEIDHGIHPHALDRIVERLRGASRRTQLLIATHSPALVNRLDASELLVCERDPETGETRLPAIDAATVSAMAQGELQLGELWFSGSLGGSL